MVWSLFKREFWSLSYIRISEKSQYLASVVKQVWTVIKGLGIDYVGQTCALIFVPTDVLVLAQAKKQNKKQTNKKHTIKPLI